MTDFAAIREAMSCPGGDTRAWISYGVVADHENAIRFDQDLGPLVDVDLQPESTPVVCRVASFIAGPLEGTWYPFVAGDEVIVCLPEGNERAGCVILGRLNQKNDPWPRTVAGQDATENKLGFMRMRAPFVMESANGILFRHATTGAQFGIDATGRLLLNDGGAGRLMLSSDVIGLQDAGGTVLLQLKIEALQAILRAGEARLTLDSDESQLTVPGNLNIGTSGAAGVGNAVTIQQVTVLIQQIFNQIYVQNGATPGTPATIDMFQLPKALLLMNAAIPLSATMPIDPITSAALSLAMIVPQDPTGLIPGIARVGLLL